MALCDANGVVDSATPVSGTRLPTFAVVVAGAGVVIVWVIAERYSHVAIRYLFDLATGQRFG